MRFRTLSLATAALAITLFACLLLAPGLVLALFAVPIDAPAGFLARRAAMLFLGFAVLSYLARDVPHSSARQAVAAGVGASMLGLAMLGLAELARGYAGPGILLAVVGELAFAVGHLSLWWRHRQTTGG